MKMTDKPILTDEEWGLWRRQHGKELTDDMFAEFRLVAERKRLNPMERQITARVQKTKYGPKLVIICNIDGYRLIADRTGVYAGNDDAVCLPGDTKQPSSAQITVYKMVEGQRCAFSATARWDEYYPGEKGGAMWIKMPHVMLAKCAEALALRKGFPGELSGIYTDAEMDQAGSGDTPQPHGQDDLAGLDQKEVPAQLEAATKDIVADKKFLQETCDKLATTAGIRSLVMPGDYNYIYEQGMKAGNCSGYRNVAIYLRDRAALELSQDGQVSVIFPPNGKAD
jgi:phage recombination protein Bet